MGRKIVCIGFQPICKLYRTNPLIMLTLILCFLCSEGLFARNKGKAVQWVRWQHSLSGNVSTENQQVTINVVFTGPEGKTFTTPAFTDDGKIFHFRAAFPAPGVWRWKSICSDPGNLSLHNKNGKVKVKEYKGENPLFRHGDLKLSEDGRYLTHYDGTPFLWVGETGWNATLKSTMKEWCDYVDKRVSQGFSVVQISPRGSGNRNTASSKANISVREDGTTDPLFWNDLEEKIAYANDNGLFVFMVGVGSAWRDLLAENHKNQKFETYLAGRLASFMVLFSPSFDQLYEPELDRVAEELQKSTLHLVTQHPGTNYEANIKYRNSPPVDFGGLQSGHHAGNLTRAYNAARVWTMDMWNISPVKPVINIEAMYDAYGHDDARNWREKDARKLGWISWLSGSRGYTYGAGDVPPKVPIGAGAIWRFNKDSTAYDFWRNALVWPSAGQMTVMRNLFRSIEWWRLVPSHDLILNQADDETLKMVVSGTRERDLLLAYLPDNNVIILNMKDFSGNMKGKWFNPVNGDYSEIKQPVIPSAKVTFLRPDGWEDALLILNR